MTKCIFCGSRTRMVAMENAIREKLMKHNSHLKKERLFERHCDNCGHISYSRR